MSDVGIDVVFPISSVEWLPYLRNACLSVRQQDYTKSRIGIIISYLYESEERLGELASLCREYDAVLVQRKRERSDGFETPLARNAGARRAARDAIAFIDSDLIVQPETFAMAEPFLLAGNSVVIPVSASEHGPEWDIFQKQDPAELQREAAAAVYRHSSMGAVIVPAWAVRGVHGYDERMYGWGADDTDFIFRVSSYGAKLISLLDHKCPFAIHQSHSEAARESELTVRNRRLFAESTTVTRNDTEWGGVPVSAATWKEGPDE